VIIPRTCHGFSFKESHILAIDFRSGNVISRDWAVDDVVIPDNVHESSGPGPAQLSVELVHFVGCINLSFGETLFVFRYGLEV
jgi:hypothetical protein